MQEIASHGCFSLGMVTHFEPTLLEKSVWMYPRLFWETGVLGQVLYLEAHAVGISATGIGCYFDDHGMIPFFTFSIIVDPQPASLSTRHSVSISQWLLLFCEIEAIHHLLSIK